MCVCRGMSKGMCVYMGRGGGEQEQVCGGLRVGVYGRGKGGWG